MSKTYLPPPPAEIPKPSQPPVEPPPPYAKRVIFTHRNGQWEAEVELKDPARPFTDRDFNQLSTLLGVRKVAMKRLAYLAYREIIKSQRKPL